MIVVRNASPELLFHPLLHTLIIPKDNVEKAESGKVSSEATKQEPSVSVTSPKARLDGDNHHFVVSIDLPGVKAEDVKVTEHNYTLSIEAVRKNAKGEAVTKYQRNFALDKKSVLPKAEIKAALADGVLTVAIPKKPKTEPRMLTPTLSDPPVAQEDHDDVAFQLEIPGVKPEGLTVKVVEDRVFVKAERKVQSKTVSVARRSWAVDEQKVDLTSAKAYLSDGILSIVAPKTKGEDEPVGGERSFPVESGALIEALLEVEPSVEFAADTADSETKNDD